MLRRDESEQAERKAWMIETLTRKLTEGSHFGSNGSLYFMRRYILKEAVKGDIQMMMLIANTHYTVAGYLGTGGIINKLLAGMHLFKAKNWATKAICSAGNSNSLRAALTTLDVALAVRSRPDNLEIGCGDIHILMSCFAQWHKNFNARLSRKGAFELAVIAECCKIIARSGGPLVKILARATLFETVHDIETKGTIKKELTFFVTAHYENLMRNKQITDSDYTLAQVFCRITRTLGMDTTSAEIAARYNLGDQLKKARA